MPHLLGYARVSTAEQDPALQHDALLAAGCARVFTHVASGARDDRPELARLLEHLLPGDTLVVWRLDRLGRSLRHLIDVITDLDDRGVGFRSLTESIDTTTAGGRLVFHLFGALAEFERQLIRDRTLAGLEAARTRGRHGGRPPRPRHHLPAPAGITSVTDLIGLGSILGDFFEGGAGLSHDELDGALRRARLTAEDPGPRGWLPFAWRRAGPRSAIGAGGYGRDEAPASAGTDPGRGRPTGEGRVPDGTERRSRREVLHATRQMLELAELGRRDYERGAERRLPGLYSAITSGRSVTFVLQNLRGRVANFDDWYEEVQTVCARTPCAGGLSLCATASRSRVRTVKAAARS